MSASTVSDAELAAFIRVAFPHPEWHSRGACNRLPSEWFFPEQGQKIHPKALEACSRCAVADICANDSAEVPVIVNPLKAIDHGTNRGYEMHRRRGTPPCDDCKGAHRRYKADRKAARRGEAA